MRPLCAHKTAAAPHPPAPGRPPRRRRIPLTLSGEVHESLNLNCLPPLLMLMLPTMMLLPMLLLLLHIL